MEQYIPKAAVVAEIERIQNEFSDNVDKNGNFDELENQGAYKALDILESFLDTLEVKEVDINEVDINKEISQFIGANFEKATIGHKLSLMRVSKHFFELGLKAQKGK